MSVVASCVKYSRKVVMGLSRLFVQVGEVAASVAAVVLWVIMFVPRLVQALACVLGYACRNPRWIRKVLLP